MRQRFLSRLTYANVTATLALFLVLSGGTAVALSGTNTVFTDDIANDTVPAGGGNPAGGLVAADLRPNSVGSSEVVNFGLSNQDVGVLFAEVSADGTLENSSGGVTSHKFVGTPSAYEVDFGRDVTECTAVATIGGSGYFATEGQVTVADRNMNAEAVYVRTSDSAGALVSWPFRLVVVC
jgi:hypothetical protein